MTPYDQLLIHDPDNGVLGDCWRTCIGCLLGIEPAQVPHFAEHDDWQQMTLDFLNERGYSMVHISMAGTWPAGAHCIASGQSPRKVFHAVIAKDKEVVHDPHPSKGGLLGEPKDWELTFIIPIW